MTKAQLISALEQYPLDAEIEMDIATDDGHGSHVAEPRSVTHWHDGDRIVIVIQDALSE